MIFRKLTANHRSPGGRTSIFANAIVVAGFLTLVKIAGAAKIILMANRFGASDDLDAFLVAFSLPAFFSEVIVGSLAPALVPALIGVREAQDRTAMHRLHGSITLIVLALLAIGCVLLVFAAPFLLRTIASGFSDIKRTFAQTLFIWLLIFLPCGGLSVMWRAALISEERFAASTAATGMIPIVSLLVLLFAHPGGSIWLLVAATLGGIGLELLVLAVAMQRAGIPLMPRWGGWNGAIRQVLTQYVPLIAATAIGGGNLMIDQAMAATLAPGSVSALNYGTKLASVIAAIAGGALGTAVLPPFSSMAAAGRWDGLRDLFRAQSRMILLTGIPVCALMFALSGPLVRLIFRDNSFVPGTAELIASVQQFSLMQIPVALLLVMALRLVSAMNANALLLRVALVKLAASIAGNFLLMRVYGVPGIALSSSLAMTVSFILVILGIRRHIARIRVLEFRAS